MKPLVKYRGGKTKEIPHLINHIPNFSGSYSQVKNTQRDKLQTI